MGLAWVWTKLIIVEWAFCQRAFDTDMNNLVVNLVVSLVKHDLLGLGTDGGQSHVLQDVSTWPAQQVQASSEVSVVWDSF